MESSLLVVIVYVNSVEFVHSQVHCDFAACCIKYVIAWSRLWCWSRLWLWYGYWFWSWYWLWLRLWFRLRCYVSLWWLYIFTV